MSTSEQYARDVLDGKIIAGRLIKLACERFLKDLQRDDIYFDEVEANKFILFSERYLKLWEDKWRGQPVIIKPWMAFIFQQVFGWIKKDSGLRRVRKVFVEVAKKNAKSTLAGSLANFHLFADERIKTPKIFVGANNEDQAKICVNIAGKMIEQSPDLYDMVVEGTVDLFSYKENIVNIVHRDRDGFIKAMSKEASNTTTTTAGGKHGINPSLWLIDEYAMADSDALLNTFESAQAAREEPLGFAITTAGFKQNGPCYSQLRRTGIEILEGLTDDDSYLAFIWEPDPEDKIEDETTWPKSNPNIGISVFHEFLRSRLRAAKNEGGSKEVDVKTLNFNTWCEAAEVWIPVDTWNKNAHEITDDELLGRDCFTGYDFAARIDICAVALIFPNVRIVNDKQIHAVRWFYWMPQARIKNNKERMDYSGWVNAGLIEAIPGDTIEWDYIITRMRNELPKYNHHSGAYDPYLATNGVIQGLAQEGIMLNPISQGFASISEPTKEWERLLTNGQIDHGNNPVSAWMNKNTTIIRDANRNIKIQKIDGEKGALKIDGIAAGINAMAQYMSVPIDNDQLIESW